MAGWRLVLIARDRLVTNHSRNAGNLPKIDLNTPSGLFFVVRRRASMASMFRRNSSATESVETSFSEPLGLKQIIHFTPLSSYFFQTNLTVKMLLNHST